MITLQPCLTTERLLLRPFVLADASDVQRLAGEWEVAKTTLLVPHPYPAGAAEAWISTHPQGWASGRSLTWALTGRVDGTLVGAMGLVVEPAHARGDLGYWIGRPHWGQGLATEAARAVVAFGFEGLGLHRIQATHMTSNPASGRVMEKLGMRREGVHRDLIRRWDRFEDVAQWAIVSTDERPGRAAP
jgi:RimJ/RimL family protein N-acetyltransferase